VQPFGEQFTRLPTIPKTHRNEATSVVDPRASDGRLAACDARAEHAARPTRT
jgi:hypothetical protein